MVTENMEFNRCEKCGGARNATNRTFLCQCRESPETKVADARTAPTPPRLIWATDEDTGWGFAVHQSGRMVQCQIETERRMSSTADSTWRTAVIAEPTDLQAVAEECFDIAYRMTYRDPEAIAAIRAVLEKNLYDQPTKG